MNHVIYKGEKFKVSIIYQHYGLERTPLKHMELRNRDINSINEIEGLLELKRLQSLDLSYNNIADMSGLEELTNLKILYIGNRISEIKGLEKLTKLTHLWLGSEISEIKGLENLSNLLYLKLGRKISEINNLDNLTNLTGLDLSYNQISEIKGLGELRTLRRLGLSDNQITEIKGLNLLENIFDLDLSSNRISEIKELSHLRNLTILNLSFNEIQEIKRLESLKKIGNLRLSSNQITKIKGVNSLTGLQELDLSNNQITSVKKVDNLHGFVIDLYSNPIPQVEMERFRGYINGNFVVHSQSYGNQILILFNNSHEKIRDNSYDFSIYCRNIDGKPPNPNFGITFHLINPMGKALQPFQMSLHPSNLKNPEYDSKRAVKFHISIDLNTLYEEEGLWHYFFTLKDESNKDQLIYIPENGYILGPETSPPSRIAVFCSHSVSSIPGEYSGHISAGFIKNNYEFIADIFYWKDLKEMFLYLIPAQKIEGMGISNTVGIKKFKMKLAKPDSDYTDIVDFRCVINFENLGYKDAELGRFYHYYEGILKDGTKSYHYQQKSFYSKHEDSEFSDKEICEDFKEPFVASNHPQLVDYIFEDTKHLIYSPSCFLAEIEVLQKESKTEYQVKSDYTLRFEVLYSDSMECKPFDGYPRLIFRNKELDKKFEFIMFPNNVISIFTRNYSEVFDSYICDVNWANLPEGIWYFYFEAKNSKENQIKNLVGKEIFLRV
ncbi:hypothetical protein LCGC14_1046980 [marine sediment metagenome]|uniref:Leucine-rich repeat domain-containing protein n=1 Tax=marine sediment metagenome TaxID=412755 RepID=A0A0F9QW66_9ZZZZ